MRISVWLMISLAAAQLAQAQQDSPTDAPVPPESVAAGESEQAPSGPETPDVTAPERPPLGWLSDPDAPPEDLLDALVSGKIHLNNRFRIELADTTGLNSSTAITNRIRLGYESKPFHGLSGLIEMENVATPARDNYFVPATGDGTPDRTPVADPPGTEVNQAYGRFQLDSILESGFSLDLKAGRQRIKLDDDRFIGNVGWRQFEQTFDAVSARSSMGVEELSVFYAYVWGVQRVFGPNGPNPKSDSHLINISYRVAPELTITPFVYLLDFEDDDPLNSVNSYGLRLTGRFSPDTDRADELFVDYELTYARQTDAGSNPVDFAANFVAAQARVTRSGLGFVTIGYQLLGSDDGNFGFRFPLGTNHAFQGFADEFLVTPPEGVQDLYVTGGVDLPHGIKPAVTLHQFWSDEGGDDLGNEIDLVASKQFNRNWSVLAKAAFFNGHNGEPDTTKFWIQTTISF